MPGDTQNPTTAGPSTAYYGLAKARDPLSPASEWQNNLTDTHLAKRGMPPTVAPGYVSNPPKSGLVHTMLGQNEKGRFVPNFKRADAEHVIENNGAYIVLGTDRPSSIVSGKGGSGYEGCASIDLVVGRMSNMNDGPKTTTNWVDNNFMADSARIYIGQLTDVDSAFALAPGLMGPDKDRSAIGLKADGIRIIGRTGIRLITGKADGVTPAETSARGGKIIQPAPIIEFISGNDTDDEIIWGGLFNPRERYKKLQPLVMGENLQHGLLELCEMIQHTGAMVNNLTFWFGIAIQALGTLAATNPAGGIAASTLSLLAQLKSQTDTLLPNYAIQSKMMTWKANYIVAIGRKSIISRNVFTT